MKKSRIIVPAMALIAFTSFASIAGSVAWFTASRTVTVSAGTYAVVKTTTNLECALSAGVGATGNSSTHVVTPSGTLTDGSFNHITKKIYTPDEEGTGLHETNGEVSLFDENLTTKMTRVAAADASDGKVVYTAITWGLSFTVSFGGTSGDYGLFLNCDSTEAGYSNFAVSDAADAKTAKGFRIALVPANDENPANSSRNSIVFADLQVAAKCHYIASTSDAGSNFETGTNYGVSDRLIDSEYTAVLPTSETARDTALARPDCLGVFGFAASTRVTLNYIAVAWFEGTDEEIFNRNAAADYQAVVATLKFDAVKLKAAADPEP